jgi:DNA-binding CsgD family transcriptional regulator
MMSDPSGPPHPKSRRSRPARLESKRRTSQEDVALILEESRQPAENDSRRATAVETDRRQLAAQVERQIIAPIKLLLAQAAAYERTFAAQPPARMAVSVLASLARQVLQQAYDLEASLHPVVLEILGLEPALEALAEQYERLHSLRLVLNLARLPQRPPADVELALFRLTQDVLDALSGQHVLLVEVALGVVDQALRLEFSYPEGALLSEPLHQALSRRIQPLGGTLFLGRLSDGQAHLAFQVPLRQKLSFTRRENQVLEGLVQGWSNKEIARQLSISPRTVNYHLDHIFAKLGVRTRTQAVVTALAQGWAAHPSGR